ncbi:MAG TPA: HD domain-containing protein [Acidobacteriaceae bacterium]|nr:HD domain-containing protein [Acidobacteriaceae bacterium]
MQGPTTGDGLCGQYQRRLLDIRGAFATGANGAETVAARAAAVDELILGLWALAVVETPMLGHGIALLAVGGYGRRELFPYSDVDLLYLLDGKVSETEIKQPIRRISQQLWDCGIRLSPTSRKRSEAERFDEENAEFTVALLDHRLLTGDAAVYQRLAEVGFPKMLEREHKALASCLVKLTDERHAKYGDTPFHLEPSIKDCPGGLRDVHVCAWLQRLADAGREAKADAGREAKADAAGARGGLAAGDREEFRQAVNFLFTVRCFLHYRHERDDNTLDWHAQDAAAAMGIGMGSQRLHQLADPAAQGVQAAYWMRLYFRHARSVERCLTQMLDGVEGKPHKVNWTAAAKAAFARSRRSTDPDPVGFRAVNGRLLLDAASAAVGEPAQDPDVVLQLFVAMARTGCSLERNSEERISQGLPLLSAHLEEGPSLWRHVQEILLGFHAGKALRMMHALGILELLLPEFHGIDALVIRDAYHRYTVDEHTMVVIDTVHGLEQPQTGPMSVWAERFGGVLRDVQHPALLFLAALLHDTGKGRSSGDHALESAWMAESVAERLVLDAYESELMLGLIRNHLEMSAALRRDIFDLETVRAFAGKVQTPEALRMLTLFTYADIQAVHPDALTPWKAENLWRLYLATASYLDRSVDDERVGARIGKELVNRVAALLPGRRAEVEKFLEGFPERYLRTRTPEQVRLHFDMAARLAEGTVQMAFRHSPGSSEITLLARDRPLLFADMAGALAAWGMNIVTADAFSNLQGIVVDNFRFTDTFRTLEMNVSEHAAFVASIHDVMAGKLAVEKLLSGRRRGRRRTPKVVVEARVDYDNEVSSHSTLLQVVAQDIPGLLRAISLALAERGCNIEVALVDTEGETAIDVFYITRDGAKLDAAEQKELKLALLAAMKTNAA